MTQQELGGLHVPPAAPASADGRALPRWSAVLRALREAAGVTREGWGARLGVSRATVHRWESGALVPGAAAEATIVAACREKGLFRTFYQGALRGLTVTPELVRDLLAEGRLAAQARPDTGARPRPLAAVPTPAPATAEAPAQEHAGLAIPHTSFVGRDQELDEVRRLLASTRLLTLTGTGGVGKSRLALHVAAGLPAGFVDGVWLVELAALTEPALVPEAVATALGVREEQGRPLVEGVAAFLRERQGLLLLDNCEHLLDACAALTADLLRACPRLRILATSRAPLGVAGERAWRVPSLSLPDPWWLRGALADTLPVERLTRYGSVQLFVDRATVAVPAFAVTRDNAPALAQVCHRLDGIPLALELAAARAKVLTVEQIAARLDDCFRLLTGGSRGAPPRQQTLRAALDWSHDLLPEPHRALLRRLSVFAGGGDLEAVEAVCAFAGGQDAQAASSTPASAASPDVLDLLTGLVDGSLVIVDRPGGEARYRLLETVRRYGLEKLEAAGGSAAVHRRHRDWYLALAERAEPELRGPQAAAWLDRLEREHDNLRQALDWSRTDPDGAEPGLRLAGALRVFWYLRGHPSEGRRWTALALAAGAAAPAAARAKALDGIAALAHSQGDYAAAQSYQEQGLALRRALGDRSGMAVALNTLGLVAMARGDYDGAVTLLEESLALMRPAGTPASLAAVLNNLGSALNDRGDPAGARPYFEESLAIKRGLGHTAGIAVSLHNLADVARKQGDYPAAVALLEESLELHRQVGGTHHIAQTLHSLGRLAHQQGAQAQAAGMLQEGLALFQEMEDQWGMGQCIEDLAVVAAAQGAYARAARLFGAAEKLRDTIGSPLSPADLPAHDRAVASVRAALGEPALARAWTGGRALTPDAAIADATRDA